jgi:hypothetical protein
LTLVLWCYDVQKFVQQRVSMFIEHDCFPDNVGDNDCFG